MYMCSNAAFAIIHRASASGTQGTRLPQASMTMLSGVRVQAHTQFPESFKKSDTDYLVSRFTSHLSLSCVRRLGRAANFARAAAITHVCSAAATARDERGRGVLGSARSQASWTTRCGSCVVRRGERQGSSVGRGVWRAARRPGGTFLSFLALRVSLSGSCRVGAHSTAPPHTAARRNVGRAGQ